MIIFYQQLENIPEVIKMLESPVESTRFLSIKAINDLRLYEGKKLIKNRFPEETEKNKVEIIKAFKNIGSEEDFSFLEAIIKSGNVTLKTEACRSMYFMGAEGKEKLLTLNRDLNHELDLYIAHVTDPRN
jgi:hypothetical protein